MFNEYTYNKKTDNYNHQYNKNENVVFLLSYDNIPIKNYGERVCRKNEQTYKILNEML